MKRSHCWRRAIALATSCLLTATLFPALGGNAETSAIQLEAETACTAITAGEGITGQFEKSRGGTGFSGDKFSFVNVISFTNGDFPDVKATFTLTVPAAGDYTLSLVSKDNPDRGLYQAAVDEVVVGQVDFYNATDGVFVTHEVGAVTFTSTTATLTLTCAGANEKSNKKYGMALDYILLTPVGEGTPDPKPDPEPDPDPVVEIHKMEDMLKCTYTDTAIQSGPLSYRLYVPADYDAAQSYPLLIYLNGAGSRGDDNEKQLNNLAPLINPLIDNPDYPCILAVPQLPGSQQWVDVPWVNGSYDQDSVAESRALQMLRGMIADLQDTYCIDENRLYLMGQSFGGFGTWDAITRYPDLFAAAVPMCGAGDPTKAARIKDMPLLVLHGSGDGSVPVSGSREMVAALKEAGSRVTYLEYEGVDHYIQRRLFEQPALWLDWLFAQEKGKEQVSPDHSNAYPVGPDDLFMFNNNSDLTNWTTTGTFAVGGGQLEVKAASGGNAIGVLDGRQLADGMVSGFVTIPAGGAGGGGLVFRYQNDQNFLHLRLTGGNVELLEMVNGTVAKKHSVAYAWVPGRITCLKAEMLGNRIIASVDNDVVMDVTVQTAALSTAGQVGLRYYSGSMKVDDFVVSARSANTLSQKTPVDRQVIQRNPETKTGEVTFTGVALVEGMSRLELAVEDFATGTPVLAATPVAVGDNGAYTATLTLPQGGWYRTVLRALDADGGVLATHTGDARFGVGMNILCIGQSNMVGQGQDKNYVVADDLVSNFKNETWAHLVDPYAAGDTSLVGGGSNGGSMVPTLGNQLVEAYGIPVGFIPAAQNGASLLAEHNGWLKRTENNPADRTNLYGNSLFRAQAAGGIEFIIMNQGENNVSRGTDAAIYQAGLAQLQQNYAADLGYSVPIVYCQLGAAMASSWDSSRDPYMSGIRTAQAAADNGDTLIMGASLIDLTRNGDNLHFDSASQTVIGRRMANAIQYALGDADYYKGPAITAAAAVGDGKQIEVTLTHQGGTDITPDGNITGFEVFADGVEVLVTGVARKDATTLTLTLETAVSGEVTLRYLYGCLPDVTGLVRDNSPLQLPLLPVENMAVSLPAEEEYRLGDVDESGTIDVADALMALQAITGKVTLTESQTLAADTDKDGNVAVADALEILQHITGKIDLTQRTKG